jgi:hypothetical protein
MSEDKSDFILSRDGKFYERYERLREIDPGAELQKAFAANITTITRNLLNLEGHGPVHVVVSQGDGVTHVSVPMEELNFRATFATMGDEYGSQYQGQLFPTFRKDMDDTIMEIPWNRAAAMAGQKEGMRLRFHVLCKPNGEGWYAYDHYLYAFDDKGRAHRLPIANLHDTCQVCMGSYDSKHSNLLGTVQKALHQFRTASWNSDLFKHSGEVWKFVRFKALEKGFETQPIIVPWTQMCATVATAHLKNCPV